MKIESRIFEAIAVFFIVMGIIYAVATYFYRTGVEWAGVACLFFSAALSLLVGSYFRFVARRVEIRPEDYDEAEIEDGAGELGFFSPHSYWPIMIAGAAALFAIGFATGNFWFSIGVALFLVAAVVGLVMEYHVGPEKH
ncbi:MULTISPECIES: cytochrome c oxidase subunit 4 [unclassified Gordonia (in: high G+C Gram-positive bacteria)]|uniref:cytochrome c oxidase subunit 4 n=1 Tax=unclassified Gordonia (in: high G+C Gram-positive bacteria) TaxID=2657482 RepID=UPI001FFF00D1|nr:cytochrome c oxidase subunit 4 [Gordonia sp. PP30]UQE73632.1 cytochrome c oxidase subunit 4 [Gordonia sp. PP30]